MKRALISVSDKAGIIEFARGLVDLDYEIISTGGTSQALAAAGIPIVGIAEVTQFPEILDGRVKTLHPNIHAGILARGTQEHMDVLAQQHIQAIDIVVVNLYPFQATIAKADTTFETAIENIDIGGPTMIRAAAKNHERVAVVVNPSQYETVLAELQANGILASATKSRLALAAFQHTAQYDAAISQYLQAALAETPFAAEIAFGGEKIQNLRYGENPHQQASFYRMANPEAGTMAGAEQLHGKELSYNNIVDADAAWQLVNEFRTLPTAVIIKHTNPCGVASAESLHMAYEKALAADPVSAFGGIIACNEVVDGPTATKIVETFMEAVIAPDFTSDALAILKSKKNLRLLKTGALAGDQSLWIEKISGGFLVQETDPAERDVSFTCPTTVQPTEDDVAELLFAWRIAKHVKSNAIVVTNHLQSIGVGAGQMNRVGSCEIAFAQGGEKCRGAYLASDAFFPFRDSIDAAHKAGIKAIIQPGGSVRDDEVIAACNEYGITMIFTGKRHFKH